MFWRLHKAIFGDRINEAIAIIEQFKDTYQIVEGAPSQLKPVPFDKIEEPILALTTLQDAQRLIRKDYPSTPWLFFNNNSYKVSYWLSRIEKDISVLNRDSLFLPFGILKNCSADFFNTLSQEKLFIKPDSGNKIFTGFTINNDNHFTHNLQDNLKFSHIEPEEMCVISSAKNIQETEWRFWICERKIVAYTPYSWDNEPDLIEPPDEIMKLAIKMTKNNWQPDYSYVADFCIHEGEAKLIEINATSTSGIYQVDLNALLSALRKTSVNEYDGIVDID